MFDESAKFAENTELFTRLPDEGAREELVNLYLPLAKQPREAIFQPWPGRR